MKTINGANIRKMFLYGYGLLDKNKAAVDALNVFPVPDGDTGINMSLTLKSVIKELEMSASNDLGSVCETVSRGALKGARGNSGVILSQILKGMMTELAIGKSGADGTDVKTFAHAMVKGSEVAYKAVAVPREGTILTVIRVMGEEARKIAKANMDFEDFLDKILIVGEEILAQTPEMLPQLKKAGVVDSGGRGLLIMFAGFLAGLRGDEGVEIDLERDRQSADGESGHIEIDLDGLDGIEFAYCTQFCITHMYKTTTLASIDSFREKILTMGDSVACVGDLNLVNTHVHTNNPGEVLTLALRLGEVTQVNINNMLEENREMRAANNMADKDQAMVAIAAGEGLINVFRDLGCDYVIKGGQTMNPSAEDIAEACRRVHAENIYLFPNNSNILLAAKHAQALVNKNIIIIPTKAVTEGISACIQFNPEGTIEENTEAFLDAIKAVKSGSVTTASRTTKLDRFDIKQGDIIGLNEKSILAKGSNPAEVVIRLIERMISDDMCNITLFYGANVTEKEAHALQDKLISKFSNCEVNAVFGGQPVYYYFVSLE